MKRGRDDNQLLVEEEEEGTTASLRGASTSVSNRNDGISVDGCTTVKKVDAPRPTASSADASLKDGNHRGYVCSGADGSNSSVSYGGGIRSCEVVSRAVSPENIVASHLVSTVLSPIMMTSAVARRRSMQPNSRPSSSSGISSSNNNKKAISFNCNADDATCGNDLLLSYLHNLLIPSSDGNGNEGIIGVRRTTAGGNQGQRLRKILDGHKFRTSIVTSPADTDISGPAVSIYRDSCHLFDDGPRDGKESEEDERRNGKEFLLIAFGLHQDQDRLEKIYKRCFRRQVCVLLFCRRVRDMVETTTAELRNKTVDAIHIDTTNLEQQLQDLETDNFSTINRNGSNGKVGDVASYPSEYVIQRRIDTLMSETVKRLRSHIRLEVLQREYQRISSSNCTLANVLVTYFASRHNFYLRDIEWKPVPHAPKFERITVHFSSFSSNTRTNLLASSFFTTIPSLSIALNQGMNELVEVMVGSLWIHMLRHGYVPSNHMKETLHHSLHSFFVSGLGIEKNGNARLKSQFVPTYPFSAYIHGQAGTGKSSFARIFPLALQATLEEHVDPDISVRMVKQNLNKPQHILQVEMELRNNNNDLSVMSIIQGRRQAMRQAKPGLVVVDLEEMPEFDDVNNGQPTASHRGTIRDPNQLDVAKLISHRFAGRKGSYQQPDEPRNTEGSGSTISVTKRGIGKDSSLLTVITSNYPLSEESKTTFQKLEIFENLCVMNMSAISGEDREKFAESILKHYISDHIPQEDQATSTDLVVDIPVGDGDVRPIVTSMRSLSYFLGMLVKQSHKFSTSTKSSIESIRVIQRGHTCSLSIYVKNPQSKEVSHTDMNITVGGLGVWFPSGVDTRQLDCGNEAAIQWLEKKGESGCNSCSTNIQMLLEYWRSRTLTPTVFISRHKESIQLLMGAIGTMSDINFIRSVNTQTYKMTKSLYDREGSPNLRDDILSFGRGALVAVEMYCPTMSSQLCIREMIEDSPSMTAFSTTKSALTKAGLLFAIHIEGDITPEILSRASCIL